MGDRSEHSELRQRARRRLRWSVLLFFVGMAGSAGQFLLVPWSGEEVETRPLALGQAWELELSPDMNPLRLKVARSGRYALRVWRRGEAEVEAQAVWRLMVLHTRQAS